VKFRYRGLAVGLAYGLLLRAILLVTPQASNAQTHEEVSRELKAFPMAEEGMCRHVLYLPKEENEELLKVQLIVGKTIKLDPQNRYFFGGKLEQVTIPGWGYDRYVLKDLGPMAGTLMAVDPNIPKVDRFISLGGEPELLRYNSRLPLVITVPQGVEVRYRIWSGDAKDKTIPEG
jgi:ecotin